MQNHANYVKVLALVVFLLVSCGLPPLSQPTAIVLVTETPLEIRDAQIIGEPYNSSLSIW